MLHVVLLMVPAVPCSLHFWRHLTCSEVCLAQTCSSYTFSQLSIHTTLKMGISILFMFSADRIALEDMLIVVVLCCTTMLVSTNKCRCIVLHYNKFNLWFCLRRFEKLTEKTKNRILTKFCKGAVENVWAFAEN